MPNSRRVPLTGNTKGLISPYLIVSVLLIIAVSLLLYTGQLQRFFGPLRASYPVEIEAVARQIQDCAVHAGTEAVHAIATQGGMIYIPLEVQQEYDSFLALDDLHFRVIPFWVHRGRSRIPTIPFMEKQISDYTHNKTIACIDQFRSLGDHFLITEEGNLSITTSITKDSVYLSLTYPIKILPKATLKETRLREFTATIPARLGRTYELAKKIMQFQNKKLALENLTIDLMSMDPQVPMNHLGVECKPQTWNTNDVKEHLQEVIATNLLTIRIKNTDHVPFEAKEETYQGLAKSHQTIQATLEEGTEEFSMIPKPEFTPPDAFEYFHTYFDVGTEQTPMSVAFEYHPEYGMDLLATPNQNGRLSSTVYKASERFLGFLCLNAYHFTYTLRYPVIVRIFDPASFGGLGLTFDYAFPVSIKDNAPEPTSLAKRYISDIRPIEGFCTKIGNTFYEIRAIGSDEEGYISNAGLDNVNISYRCAGRHCTLGTTQAEAGAYALITPLPSGCKNPQVMAQKEGYLHGEATVKESTTPTIVPLTRLKTLPLTVKKIPYFAFEKKTGQPQDLAPDENLTIRISALTNKEYQQFIPYPQEDAQITLIEASNSYRIDIVLIKGDRIIGGAFATNITLSGKDVSQANAVELTVTEYRPTPISDSEEAAMALYLSSKAPSGKEIITLR